MVKVCTNFQSTLLAKSHLSAFFFLIVITVQRAVRQRINIKKY
jgi:hypothetical protein